MKILNIETATIEELKAGVYDNIKVIENLNRQNDILNQAIRQKEQNQPILSLVEINKKEEESKKSEETLKEAEKIIKKKTP